MELKILIQISKNVIKGVRNDIKKVLFVAVLFSPGL
jgi:hypothetical protein